MDLTPDKIFDLLQSTEDYPVDFEDAWRWVGYSRKDNAKNALLNAGFIEGVDFRVFLNIQENSKKGRPLEQIGLTVDCFKSFAMMAGTARGKEVRHYFLECERQLKEILGRQRAGQKRRIVNAIVQDDAEIWAKRFKDEFFDEVYRITGWQRPEKGHPDCMGQFINQYIYSYFPEGVPERLQQVNPKNKRGNRARKHHQHLTATLGLPILAAQKAATVAVMRLSPDNSLNVFKRNMSKACGSQVQTELPFMDEFNQLEGAS